MYERCQRYNIPHKKVGKLVVAHDSQRSYIERLHDKAQRLPWPAQSLESSGRALPTQLISGDAARELEPNLSKKIVAALWSPETGIVDSHSFMESLEKDISESEAGELVYDTRVPFFNYRTAPPGFFFPDIPISRYPSGVRGAKHPVFLKKRMDS